MEEPTTEETAAPAAESYEQSDVFLWANNLVPIKEELVIELFLFNKNYVVYRAAVSKDLRKSLEPLLVDNLLEFVLEGAESGLTVREFEEGEAEGNVLQRTKLRNVENARMALNWLKTQEHEIETFVEEEHDFKRIKGLVARCTHASLPKPFYIIKALSSNMVMKGSTAWLMRGGRFVPFDADGSLQIPKDNQLLVVDQDMYVFNQAKLESLFGYNAKKYGIALDKIKLIGEHFKLSFAESSFEEMIKGKKALVNKLQKIDPLAMKQEDLLNHAEEIEIPLMTDDTGAIILMDGKDLNTFVNLLNDDYMESPVTGLRYEIKTKRPLKPPDDEDLLKQVM
ncbi:MAG TPA: Kiwa anti-phage protein KwaB-like domain-containing protein [Verrucomicrobiae bacterium]|nr:Kiwa anti-phage protein KwaB-like domain-containing protein [Verrucomicrobiae bacterium]